MSSWTSENCVLLRCSRLLKLSRQLTSLAHVDGSVDRSFLSINHPIASR
jgi:hypothetical protein